MRNGSRLSLLLLLIVFACGCAERSLIALIPDPEGKTGSITVGNEAGDVTIDDPYQATTIKDAKRLPSAPAPVGKKALDKMFADALSIEPQRPLHFLLYFREGTELRCDSAKLLADILAAIKEKNSRYISVVGHADTLGSAEYNLELSKKRALAVKELLVQSGVPAETIETTSHGKENPLIPTADNVYEPRNRRVEVVVR
jgi:outer membrane protein OmpA-like peptidoglycan-associated protein